MWTRGRKGVNGGFVGEERCEIEPGDSKKMSHNSQDHLAFFFPKTLVPLTWSTLPFFMLTYDHICSY